MFDNLIFFTTRSIRTNVQSIRGFIRMSVPFSGVSGLLSGVSGRRYGCSYLCPEYSDVCREYLYRGSDIRTYPDTPDVYPEYPGIPFSTGWNYHPVPKVLLWYGLLFAPGTRRYRVVFPPGTTRYRFLFVLFFSLSWSIINLLIG